MAAPTTAIIYLTRPTIGHIKAIANHIKQHSATSPPSKHLYHVLLVPRSSVLVKKIFEDEGVLGDVNLSTFEMGFIPLEDDLLSLERDNAFKEIWMVRIFLVFVTDRLSDRLVCRTATKL